MLAVVLVPTLIAIWLSLTDWQPTSGVPWYDAELIWFWNFNDLWFDDRFTAALIRTIVVVAVCVVAELGIALSLALLLGRRFEFSWLSDANWAMAPIMLAEIWQWTPLMFLLVLTGFMNLPRNQVRAAIVLGASPARIFFRIMLPLLTPVITLALLTRAIETFKIFDPVYILTRGGPGASTETISMFMYNGAFVYFRMGYVAAAALIVLVVVTAICMALARPLQRHG